MMDEIREKFIKNLTREMGSVIDDNNIFPSVVRRFCEGVWTNVIPPLLNGLRAEVVLGDGMFAVVCGETDNGRFLGFEEQQAPRPVGMRIQDGEGEQFAGQSIVICKTKESAMVLQSVVDKLVESFDDENGPNSERRPGECESNPPSSESVGLGALPEGAAEQLGANGSPDGEGCGTVAVEDGSFLGRTAPCPSLSGILRGLGISGEQQSVTNSVPLCDRC